MTDVATTAAAPPTTAKSQKGVPANAAAPAAAAAPAPREDESASPETMPRSKLRDKAVRAVRALAAENAPVFARMSAALFVAYLIETRGLDAVAAMKPEEVQAVAKEMKQFRPMVWAPCGRCDSVNFDRQLRVTGMLPADPARATRYQILMSALY